MTAGLAVPLGGSVPAIVGGSHFVAFLVSFRGTTDHTQLYWSESFFLPYDFQ